MNTVQESTLYKSFNTFFILEKRIKNKMFYYQPLISKLQIKTLHLPFDVCSVLSIHQDHFLLLGANNNNRIYVYQLNDHNNYALLFIIRNPFKTIQWLKGVELNLLWAANSHSVGLYQFHRGITHYYSMINKHESIQVFEEIDNNAYAATDNGILYHYFINNNDELCKEYFCVFDGDEQSDPILKVNQHTLYFCFNSHRIYLLNRLYGQIITSFRTEMIIKNILIDKFANRHFIALHGIREGINSLEIYNDCIVQIFNFQFVNSNFLVIENVYSPRRVGNYTKYEVTKLKWIKKNQFNKFEVKQKKIKSSYP